MSINCKLNKTYLAAVKKKTLKRSSEAWREGYRFTATNEWCIRPTSWEYLRVRNLSCCGISEISFVQLMTARHAPGHGAAAAAAMEDRDDFADIVASYIDLSRKRRDKRLIIVGLPVHVGNNSLYRMSFYKKLFKVLKSFGFVELVNGPYTNKNSRNKITVLAGQF